MPGLDPPRRMAAHSTDRLSDRLLGGASRIATQALSSLTGPRLSILIFHRVLPQADPIFPAEVDAAQFDRLMALVARSFQVLPLGQAVQRLERGTLPPRALAITFDDGYADNHDVALPILQRHGLSACFFIATGFLDGGRMFNDTVIECVRRSPLAQVDLAAFGLGVLPLGTPAQRAQAIGQLLPKIKYLPPDERPAALQRLQGLLGPTALPDDLMLRSGQVQALHRAGMEIGAHTVRHPILAVLPDAQAEQEMADSRDRLQALTGAPVTLFAYPNGRPGQDYDQRHAEMARRLGFVAAVTTAVGTCRSGADPFQLPRFTPWDPRVPTWAAKLVAARWPARFAVASASPAA